MKILINVEVTREEWKVRDISAEFSLPTLWSVEIDRQDINILFDLVVVVALLFRRDTA